MAEMVGRKIEMNVAAIRRVDPYVIDIIDSAKHVALYTFNYDVNAWERIEIEGALFVYSRTGYPVNNLVIINRLNTDNFIDPITNDIELQLQAPFLLYRNSRYEVLGIWFYDKEDCLRLASVLEKLAKQASSCKKSNRSRENGDIYSILSKAQKSLSEKVESVNPKESDTNQQDMPKGVVDFFAKASSGSSQLVKNQIPRPPGIFPSQSAPRTVPVPIDLLQSPVENKPINPLLHHIMSNPQHSVEHIEKQQRSVTPQSDDKNMFLSNCGSNGLNGLDSNLSNLSLHTLPGKKRSSPIEIPSVTSNSHSVAADRSFAHISPPLLTAVAKSSNSQLSNHVAEMPIFNISTEVELLGKRPKSVPPHKDFVTPQKPELIPPTMFTGHPNTSTPLNSSVSKKSSITKVSEPKYVPVHSDVPSSIETVLLNKNQFLRAFYYMLKNDDDFVTKMHQAYLQSLEEMISKNGNDFVKKMHNAYLQSLDDSS